MRVIKLTDNQYALLQAFIDKAAGYDSVQDTFCEVAAELLGHTNAGDNAELEEHQWELEIDLQNSMFEAIDKAEEIPE